RDRRPAPADRRLPRFALPRRAPRPPAGYRSLRRRGSAGARPPRRDFALDELLSVRDDGHAAPETAVRLGELEADIVAAEDDEMLGQRSSSSSSMLRSAASVPSRLLRGHSSTGRAHLAILIRSREPWMRR